MLSRGGLKVHKGKMQLLPPLKLLPKDQLDSDDDDDGDDDDDDEHKYWDGNAVYDIDD